VVVAADNHEAHVYFVTSAVPAEDERVKGDVKNRVKKGGWSQKRYARRRENELLHYAKDVVQVLEDLNQRRRFDRIIFVGAEEAMRTIREYLPPHLQEKLVDSKPLGLHDEKGMWDQVFEIFETEERASETALWERIRSEFMRGGRAVMGFDDVLNAATMGRVEKMIVTRDVRKAGTRCRECENVAAGEITLCPFCKSRDVFKVDLVDDLVRLLATTSADTEFSDPIDELTSVGDVAALLRY
jgi:peptide subunit release factor 1 (eRF1)